MWIGWQAWRVDDPYCAPDITLNFGHYAEKAAVMCGLWAVEVPPDEHPPWRAFAAELGPLFQVVDDVLDGDGYVLEVGEDGARRLADEVAGRAQARLAEIDADTDVLAEIVDGLAVRTA